MKRHSFSTTLVLVTAGLFLSVFFSSCLKEEYLKNEDGEYVTDSLGNKIPSDSSIIYITQEIPDINKFMPDTLLKYMNKQGALHYGTEPPKIDGLFMADTLFILKTILMPESHYHNSMAEGSLRPGKYGLTYQNQLWSVLNCEYSQLRQITSTQYYYECSTDDSTYHILHANFDKFKEYETTPSYFKDENFNTDEFKNTYIIGKNPYFTMFFYQVIRNEIPVPLGLDPSNFQAIIANIVSGKYNKDANGTEYISEFFWGRQCIGYINTGIDLDKAIEQGFQPYYGDAWICNNSNMPVYRVLIETSDNEESTDNE